MDSIQIRLNISTNAMQSYYNGDTRTVFTRAIDGRTVQFPAHILRPYLTTNGVQGRFELNFDDHGYLMNIKQC